jgi:hypothetical protein
MAPTRSVLRRKVSHGHSSRKLQARVRDSEGAILDWTPWPMLRQGGAIAPCDIGLLMRTGYAARATRSRFVFIQRTGGASGSDTRPE